MTKRSVPIPAPEVGDGTKIIGVGIDTARYGHHVTFLRSDLQPAAQSLEMTESRQGYQQLHECLERLQQRFPGAHFHIRVDMAGQYGANMLDMLHKLPWSKTISVGDPVRNSAYRKAHRPKRKSDDVESYCMGRFATVEQPPASPPIPAPMRDMQEIASRLESQTRQDTRLTNQLHNLLSRVFPELAPAVPDVATQSMLRLLIRYPTPQKLTRARQDSLTAMPYMTETKVKSLQELARHSVGSFQGPVAEQLVAELAGQIRANHAAVKRLEKMLVTAYHALPEPNHLDSIPGFGQVTAAILTAMMIDIDRFETDRKVVGFFGVFPEESTSGFDRRGVRYPPGTMRMSAKGNDLVRKYLWFAAKSAITCNPACRSLYRRLRARGTRGDVALGHVMVKLLHLAYAVWKSGRPFDPEHYPWEAPVEPVSDPTAADQAAQAPKKAAGHRQDMPAELVVTAAPSTVDSTCRSVKTTPELSGLRLTAVREHITMEQVLAHLGYLKRFRGPGSQRRGPCPIHDRPDSRARSFSVNLDKNIFQCFQPACQARGNVLDLWAAIRHLTVPDAARDLIATLALHGPPDRPDATVRPPGALPAEPAPPRAPNHSRHHRRRT